MALPLIENSPLFYGGMSFEEFVAVVCDNPDSIAEHHFTSQLYQITDDTGNLLVNYIGKLETLNEDLDAISKKSSLQFNAFPHFHKTKRKNYQEYYTEELAEKVRKRYASDINFFKYCFGQDCNISKIGFVNAELKAYLSNSIWIIPILKEKVRSLQMANAQIDVLEKQKESYIESLKNSLSWKITAPIRKLVDLFKKK